MHISQLVSIATVALVFGAAAAPTSPLVARDAAPNAATDSFSTCTSYAKREATVEKREAALNACHVSSTAKKEKREDTVDAAVDAYSTCTSYAKREATAEKREAALNACHVARAIEKREAALNACHISSTAEKREAALNACHISSTAEAEKREAESESLEALIEKRDIICARNPALNACHYAAEEKAKREAAAYNEEDHFIGSTV
ncbi:hypothetical protein MMC34_000915 [Xylographa carneopallida]|nr:hypothetical protein [Xylographa carneopallida]